MIRVCAGCGNAIKAGESRIEVRTADPPSNQTFHDIHCWDWELTQDTAELMPYMDQLLPFWRLFEAGSGEPTSKPDRGAIT